MDIEIWKDIPGYEGFYKVSNLGRVRSLDRKIKHSIKHFSLRKGKIMNPIRDRYLKVGLYKNGKGRGFTMHQLVAMAFLDYARSGKGCKIVVDHIDNDKHNNRLSNLQLLTCRQNITKNPRSKIGVCRSIL